MANPTTPMRGREENRPGQPGSTGTDIRHAGQQSTQQTGDRATDVASSVAHSAGQMASAAGQRVKDTASSVAGQAQDVASNLGQRAEEATSSVGSGMRSLAGTLRENLPHEGMMGSASSAVADTLERGGRYLEEEGLSGVGADFTDLIRRNPIPALLVGIGIGFLLGRTMRS